MPRSPAPPASVDYTHYVSQGFNEEQLEPLVRHARHVHARGGAPGRVPCALKDRTIDYGRLVDALRASGYDGAVALDTSGSISTSTAAS